MSRRSLLPYLVLSGGVLTVASSSIMIRFAQGLGVPSLTIAAGRMVFAALLLLPIVLARVWPEVQSLERRRVLLGSTSGLLLAIHFAAWIASLAYTSVASSVALVATNPLWVGLASLLLFRERLRPAMFAGLALTIGGSVLIALSDSRGPGGQSALFGNGLALLGAITASGYFLIGRELRRSLSILAYIWLSYTTAAVALLVVLLAANLLQGAPLQTVFDLPPVAYLLLLGLAIGPQLLGHTSFNWALKYLSATFVAVTILGEPIGAAMLAWLVFAEQFQPLQLAGFALLLAGIFVAARAERGYRRGQGAGAGDQEPFG